MYIYWVQEPSPILHEGSFGKAESGVVDQKKTNEDMEMCIGSTE